jgi:hypothetical protein
MKTRRECLRALPSLAAILVLASACIPPEGGGAGEGRVEWPALAALEDVVKQAAAAEQSPAALRGHLPALAAALDGVLAGPPASLPEPARVGILLGEAKLMREDLARPDGIADDDLAVWLDGCHMLVHSLKEVCGLETCCPGH